MYITQQNITARMLSEHLIIIHVEFNTEQKNMNHLKRLIIHYYMKLHHDSKVKEHIDS